MIESYVYWNEDDSDCGVGGWFLFDDGDADYPRNDRVVKLGDAYCISCAGSSEVGAKVTFAGVVSEETTPKAIAAGFNYYGNCAPSQMKLGDITVDDTKFRSSSIDFLDDGGANAFIDDPDLGYVIESYVYWNEDDSDCGVAGWFLFDDGDAEYPRNDRPLQAGEAFCVSCAGSSEVGATFTLPAVTISK